MAETDILNPTRGWWAGINDNPNPSYGTPRRTANNNALTRARAGAPYTRETMNQGFGFEFYYLDRPWTTMLRLQHFYQQFKAGYFTYVDHDGGERHHVGRFTGAPNPMQTSNGKYTIQGLVFEEVAGARMLQYPANFTDWSRTINVLDDYLHPAVATFAASSLSIWAAQINPAHTGGGAGPDAYEMYLPAPSVGDWAQIQYVGWGFQMKFRTDASFGQIGIYLDGVQVFGINLANGTQIGSLPAGMTYAGGVVTYTSVALDMHRIKVVAATAAPIIFPQVKVIV